MSKRRFHELHLIFFFNEKGVLEAEIGFDHAEVTRRFNTDHSKRRAEQEKVIDLSEVASVGIGVFLLTIARDQFLDRARGRLNKLLETVQTVIENHRK